jgi:tetratricopeptide (TPR) repeat protein
VTEEVLFHAVLAQPPAERAAYLDGHCSDPTLRRRVQGLLAAHNHSAGPLNAPAGGTGVYSPSDSPPVAVGMVFAGRYKLREILGEGGMGTVYVADQTDPVQRRVALKVIRGGLNAAGLLARFEQERQALALMDHPNIAKVFDAGVANGTPYFAMELIKGVPITHYCDDAKLTPRQRLELFIPVCQAVQHAHQKGIIHRDLKPSNVLIGLYDGKPVPKVIDFGVAKATGARLSENSIYTEVGSLLGTLEYMAPEQAELNNLDIDTRADVYALGVILYELLTGAVPFTRNELQGVGFAEMLRTIKEVEPAKPSTKLSGSGSLPAVAACRGLDPRMLTQQLRGELDWIAMKCLEKERSRRYETANQLAIEVQRYLADEPVLAGPPSTGYRLRKFARRNRAAVTAAALVIAALTIGIAGTTWGLLRADAARRAEAEQRALAQDNEHKALAAAAAETASKETAQAREAETKAVLEFMQNRVLAAARPEGQDGGLGREVTLRRALEAAMPFVATSFTNQPLVESRVRMELGNSFEYLGESRIAAEQFDAARGLLSRHLGPDHPDTLASMNNLALSYATLGRLTDAIKLCEETLALRRAKLGPNHPDTLKSMNNLASDYNDIGRHADALKLREETLALRRATLGPDHPDTLASMSNLAISYSVLGRHADALKLREETLALQKGKLGLDHPGTLKSMSNLAISYSDLGRHAEALKLREETLALQKGKLGLDHPVTLTCMSNLAISYSALGRHADALKLREETLALRRAKLGPDHPDTLASMSNLANSYSDLDRHADALKLREATLALQKGKLGLDHPNTLTSMSNLANSYSDLDRHADALKLAEETLTLRKAKLGPDHPDTLGTMLGVAVNLVRLDRSSEAVPIIDECVRRATGKPVHPLLIPWMMKLRLQHFQKTKDAAGCRQTAEMWEKLNRTDAGSFYNAASFRAITAALLAATAGADAARLADAEADRAMAWLKQAVVAGYRDGPHMLADADLTALRGRADFIELLWELADSGK